MAYLRLFDPVNQFALKNGALNVSGRLFVYYEATDDLADIYDENGTQLQQPAILDNNGRARGLFVDAAKTYWMDVQDRYGESLFTIRKMTPCGGGGGSSLSDFGGIVSADGSIAVNSYYEAGKLVYDLSVADDTTDMLEWLHAEGYTIDNGRMIPTYAEGSINIGEDGAMLHGGMYYHVTARVRTSSTVQPLYNEFSVMFKGQGADTVYTYRTDKLVLDCSTELNHDYEVSFDLIPSEDIGLYAEVDGVASGVSVGLIDMQVHRVYSGVVSIPDTVAPRPWVSENYQEKLTPGDGITIDENNVISAEAAQQVQADWAQSDSTAVDYIKNKPTIPSGSQLVPTATSSDAGEVLTVDQNGDPTWAPAQAPISAGDGVDITNNVVSAKVDGTTVTFNASGELVATAAAQQVQADWAQSDSTAVDFIKNKPDLSVYATQTDLTNGLAGKQDIISDLATIRSGAALGATAVQDANYVHTDNNFTNADASKLSGIASGAEVNVQSDWNQTDASADDYIKNKPTIPPGVTVDQTYDASSTNAQSGTAVAGALGTLSIPTATSDLTNDSGFITASDAPVQDVTINNVSVVNAQGVAEIPRQVNADWSSSAGASEILNKPDLSVYATNTALTNGLATKQDTISDLATIRAGAAAGATAVQDANYVHTDNNFTNADVTKLSGIEAGAEANVQSNWAESDSTSDSFIQNKPTIPSGTQLVPSATPSDAGEVLTVDSTGTPVWSPAQAPISAGSGIDITSNVVSAKVDGTTITTNGSGELAVVNGGQSTASSFFTPAYGKSADGSLSTARLGPSLHTRYYAFNSHGLALEQHNITGTLSVIGRRPDVRLSNFIQPNGKIIFIYGASTQNASWYPVWFPCNHRYDSDGYIDVIDPTVYLKAKSSLTFTDHRTEGQYIYNSDGTQNTHFNSSNRYSFSVTAPLSTGYNVDADTYDMIGDWTSITTPPLDEWVLAFWDGNNNRWANIAASTEANSYLAVKWNTSSLDVKIMSGGGLDVNTGAGIYVTNPLPTSSSSDEGKVLTVNSSGSAEWDNPATITVDQTYDSTSSNAQSGVAMAGALATKQDTFYATYGTTTWAQVQAAYTANNNTRFVLKNTSGVIIDAFFVLNNPTSNLGSLRFTAYRETVSSSQISETIYWLDGVDDVWHNTHYSNNSAVQSDWNESDTSSLAYIQNKPDLSVYATQTALTNGLATKQDTISDLATIRSGASDGATAVQPGDLATVATTGDYSDLTSKPTEMPIVAGAGISITVVNNQIVISATGA